MKIVATVQSQTKQHRPPMKLAAQTSTRRGFSLVELLMAVAIISMIAAMAVFGLSGLTDRSKETVVRRNAQSFAQMVANARAAGVEFRATTMEGIMAELAEGRNGAGVFSDTKFSLSIAVDARAEVLRICTLEPTGLIRVTPA
jgi:prepilin-type N-terminal cleavage/methylation domain-containing protein